MKILPDSYLARNPAVFLCCAKSSDEDCSILLYFFHRYGQAAHTKIRLGTEFFLFRFQYAILLPITLHASRSTIEGGAGMSQIVPVLEGDGTKIVPPKELFDQPQGEMS